MLMRNRSKCYHELMLRYKRDKVQEAANYVDVQTQSEF